MKTFCAAEASQRAPIRDPQWNPTSPGRAEGSRRTTEQLHAFDQLYFIGTEQPQSPSPLKRLASEESLEPDQRADGLSQANTGQRKGKKVPCFPPQNIDCLVSSKAGGADLTGSWRAGVLDALRGCTHILRAGTGLNSGTCRICSIKPPVSEPASEEGLASEAREQEDRTSAAGGQTEKSGTVPCALRP